MAEKLSPWCKKAKIAMIQKDIGVSDMAERLGNNRSYISSVLNGRVEVILIDDINISLSDQSVIVPSGKQPLQAGDQWYLLAVNRNKIYYFLDKI